MLKIEMINTVIAIKLSEKEVKFIQFFRYSEGLKWLRLVRQNRSRDYVTQDLSSQYE